ncbi:MAG: hypothetical protein P4M11_03550 [Candidatus Pacebacteria bacterium]|nr:hypothetical protein [Candidatus Paceibacterota bacterium]
MKYALTEPSEEKSEYAIETFLRGIVFKKKPTKAVHVRGQTLKEFATVTNFG